MARVQPVYLVVTALFGFADGDHLRVLSMAVPDKRRIIVAAKALPRGCRRGGTVDLGHKSPITVTASEDKPAFFQLWSDAAHIAFFARFSSVLRTPPHRQGGAASPNKAGTG